MKFLYKVIVHAILSCVAKASASTLSPIETSQTPQFVTITFDDAVTTALETYVTDIFTGRVNPDNQPITATFYVPHPNTDYQAVNRICNKGFEIALNSISKNGVEYWRNINSNQVAEEFSNCRTVLATFANVPFTEPYGARIPNLQVAGDATFTGYSQAGVQHDSSCVVSNSNKLFPFNLNSATTQTFFIGSAPSQPHPEEWIMPIICLRGKDGFPCNALAGCLVNGTSIEMFKWFKNEFEEFYFGKRAPITLMPSKMLFEWYPNSLAALKLFLDYLKTLPDVYVVSHREVQKWASNPTPLPYSTTVVTNACGTCNNPHTCTYTVNSQRRVMRVCGPCPEVYPELGNPTGIAPP